MRCIKSLLATAVLLGTTAANADLVKFETPFPSSTYHQTYPNLDLNNLENIQVFAETSEFQSETEINRLVLSFPNATDLVVTNFKRVDGFYRAFTRGAWIYKNLMVEVEAPAQLHQDSQIRVRLFVVEQESNLNDMHNFGHMLLETDGMLMDITPNRVADVNHVRVDGKRLSMQLMQRATSGMMGEGFEVKAFWLGHGEATFYVPAPFPREQFSHFSAVAMVVDTHTHPDGKQEHAFKIQYADESGFIQETGMEPLEMYLMQAFPEQP